MASTSISLTTIKDKSYVGTDNSIRIHLGNLWRRQERRKDQMSMDEREYNKSFGWEPGDLTEDELKQVLAFKIIATSEQWQWL